MNAYDGGSDAPREAEVEAEVEAVRGPETGRPAEGPPPEHHPAATGTEGEGHLPAAGIPRGRPGASAKDAAALTPPAERDHAPGPGPDSRPGLGSSPGPESRPGPGSSPDDRPGPAREADPRTGVAALSPRYQIAAALALAVVAVTVCVHVGMVFLHVAPSNTVTKAHGEAIDDWIYPEFEQNWKLFAPNPLQQNIAVQVRADVRTADGSSRTTGWYDLSAQDGRAIDGNLVPSHTQQNELRRAWDFYLGSHDADDRSVGTRSSLSEEYLRRIVVGRLERGGAAGEGGVVERVQVRSRTTNVPAPPWVSDQVTSRPVYRVLPWWSVPAAEGGAR
ncbi:DUF5819 family protein [Streptomyces sp. NPDC059894]|uniref:DUF5819 family protein n=1 Tax=unclassified Streptomyces TaxID=2593676 RepID=UPI00365DD490